MQTFLEGGMEFDPFLTVRFFSGLASPLLCK